MSYCVIIEKSCHFDFLQQKKPEAPSKPRNSSPIMQLTILSFFVSGGLFSGVGLLVNQQEDYHAINAKSAYSS
jgi:hypothetical protein